MNIERRFSRQSEELLGRLTRLRGLEPKTLRLWRASEWEPVSGPPSSDFENFVWSKLGHNPLATTYLMPTVDARFELYEPLRDEPTAYLALADVGVKALTRPESQDADHTATAVDFHRRYGPLRENKDGGRWLPTVATFWREAREMALAISTASWLTGSTRAADVIQFHRDRLKRDLAEVSRSEAMTSTSPKADKLASEIAVMKASRIRELSDFEAMCATGRAPDVAKLKDALNFWVTAHTGMKIRKNVDLDLGSPRPGTWNLEYRVTSLTGAVWVQAAQYLEKGADFRRCADESCQRWFEVLPGRAKNRLYCSETCSERKHNRDKYASRKKRQLIEGGRL